MVWFALVPWLILIKKNGKVVLPSLFTGFIFFLISIEWLRYSTYSAWILCSLYSTVFFIAFSFVTNQIQKRFKLPLSVITPFVWVGLEYIRSFLFTGFPWLFLGHSQHKYLYMIQIADITGVYGISFLIVLINAAIAELILSYDKKFRIKKTFFLTANIIIPLFLVISVVFYGYRCLKHYVPMNGPTVSVVQGNIPQSIKSDPDEEQQIKNLQRYMNLSMLTISSKPDLIVWPETMVPGILNIDPYLTGRNVDRIAQGLVENLAYMSGTNLLVGATSIEINGEEQAFFNSAFYYNDKGFIVNRYDKIHLVPFGEYTPLKRYLPFLAMLVPYEVDLSPGKKRVIFDLSTKQFGNVKFATLICFEDTLAPLVRQFCNDGVDFLINITNDGWFKDSAELDQHLALMAFRAIENRIGIARAANTGISAFVDPLGRVTDVLKNDEGVYKDIEGVLTRPIKMVKNDNKTIYTKYGDLFVIICLGLSGIAFGLSLFRRS